MSADAGRSVVDRPSWRGPSGCRQEIRAMGARCGQVLACR